MKEAIHKMKACMVDNPMSLHQFELTYGPYMRGNLDRTCQVRMKASNLVKFIQRHKDVGSF